MWQGLGTMRRQSLESGLQLKSHRISTGQTEVAVKMPNIGHIVMCCHCLLGTHTRSMVIMVIMVARRISNGLPRWRKLQVGSLGVHQKRHHVYCTVLRFAYEFKTRSCCSLIPLKYEIIGGFPKSWGYPISSTGLSLK